MAEMGLFTGWGPPVRGREAKSLEVFDEAAAYWGRQQEQGRIESFEVVLPHPHGGDLAGFGVVPCAHGDGLGQVIGSFQEATSELG